jgi:hypothetical protein
VKNENEESSSRKTENAADSNENFLQLLKRVVVIPKDEKGEFEKNKQQTRNSESNKIEGN